MLYFVLGTTNTAAVIAHMLSAQNIETIDAYEG